LRFASGQTISAEKCPTRFWNCWNKPALPAAQSKLAIDFDCELLILLTDIQAKFDEYDRGADPRSLDDWLFEWIGRCIGRDRDPSFERLPDPVRLFWAGRYVEWDVGNGGFPQVAFNRPDLLKDARDCYLAIGHKASAERISVAIELVREGEADYQSKDIGGLFDEFRESKLAALDDNLDGIGWWATEDRVKYAAQHREVFLALVPLAPIKPWLRFCKHCGTGVPAADIPIACRREVLTPWRTQTRKPAPVREGWSQCW
jgi:hypothetical protein